jgi:aminopeptidase N
MAWWDNLWLNEGFASWMGTKATDHFNPQWKHLAACGGRQGARHAARCARDDAPDPTTRRKRVAGGGMRFDEITYSKGQSFLRMLEAWLVEEKIRAGATALHETPRLRQHDDGGSVGCVGGEFGLRTSRAMAASWTEQPGFRW